MPPVVKSKTAKANGFETSFQAMLVDHFAENVDDVVTLTRSFRCHRSINSIHNYLYYGLTLTDMCSDQSRPPIDGLPWEPTRDRIGNIDDPLYGGFNSVFGRYDNGARGGVHRLLLVHHSAKEARAKRGQSICNIPEAHLILQVLEALAPTLIENEWTVAIVVPYRLQIGVLSTCETCFVH